MKSLFLFILLLIAHDLLCQDVKFILGIEKSNYLASEKLVYTLKHPANHCYQGSSTVHIELIDTDLSIQKRQIINLSDKPITSFFILSGFDSGVYVIRAFILNESDKIIYSKEVPFTIGMKNRNVKRTDCEIYFYPEGGHSLINFYNRVALFSECRIIEKGENRLIVKNKLGQIVAVSSYSANGWYFIDFPLMRGEVFDLQTQNGIIIKKIYSDSVFFAADTGFSIFAKFESNKVYVEMRKGEAEKRKNVFLQAWHKDVLLYESSGTFNADTAIVYTYFDTQGLENKLLRLLLKDDKGDVVSKRLLFTGNNLNESALTDIKNELNCVEAESVLSNESIAILYTPNDYLIPLAFFENDLNKPISKPNPGFNLFFYNKSMKSATVNYSIMGDNGEVLQIGNTAVDTAGFLSIQNCQFSGAALVNFYWNGKQMSGFQYINPFYCTSDTSYYLQSINMLFKSSGQESGVSIYNTIFNRVSQPDSIKELSEVIVKAVQKPRIKELEDKYINNGMFRDVNAIAMNVEDDQSAVYYSVKDYLLKKVPGLFVRNNQLYYRQGYIDFYVDESPFGSLPDLSMRDVGFIKFFKNPVRGGMSSQRGGQALPGGSGYVAGLQGSVAIYTKKNSRETPTNNMQGIKVQGYEVIR